MDKYEKYLSENSYGKSFLYMLLDRLRIDCDFYLGFGNRHSKYLWAGNEADQIGYMKAIWNMLSDSEKPEWLTYDKILEYEMKMTEREGN